MTVGESGGESPFDADPRATRPFHWVAVEEAVAKCVSKPRRGEKDAGGSSNSFRGASLRSFQRQSEKFSPRRAAPDGSSCEKHPRIRPYLVVAPSGAVRRRSGAAFALYNGSTFRSPRRGACAKRVPTCGLNCRLPLGAAGRQGRKRALRHFTNRARQFQIKARHFWGLGGNPLASMVL